MLINFTYKKFQNTVNEEIEKISIFSISNEESQVWKMVPLGSPLVANS